MAKLKKYWLKTAKSFVLAADDLVVAVVETAKAGRDRVIEWAESENIDINVEGAEIPTETAEATAEEVPAEEAKNEEAPAEAPVEEPVAEPEVKEEAKAEAPKAPADKKSKKTK